jgi:hypothetical protein
MAPSGGTSVAMHASGGNIMSGRDFFVSAPGRIACATGVIALAGPGAMAFAGPSHNDASYSAMIIIACILGVASTCMLSVYRFTWIALSLMLGVPLVAGFYIAGLSFVSAAGAGVGSALMILALLPLATVIAAPFKSGAAITVVAAQPEVARTHA